MCLATLTPKRPRVPKPPALDRTEVQRRAAGNQDPAKPSVIVDL
jgi:hypothetical protein